MPMAKKYLSDSWIGPNSQILSSKDAYNILLENWDEDKLEFVEQFKILLLNRASRVLGICEVSTGGEPGTVADPKIIFAAAIKASVSAIILAHYALYWRITIPQASLNQVTQTINLSRS